jgi:hypothetical protein
MQKIDTEDREIGFDCLLHAKMEWAMNRRDLEQ